MSPPASLARARSCGFAERRRLVADDWVQVIPLAAAALSYGIAVALGGSGFIAAFVAGLVFGVLRPPHGGEVTYLVDSGGQVLNAVTLIVFGAVALGPALHVLDWRIALYAVLSLTVVRMVPVALALVGLHARRPTVAFVGWFGPRGLASIVFAVIVLEGAALPMSTLIATVVVTVALSVLAHGSRPGRSPTPTPAGSPRERSRRRWRAPPRTSIVGGGPPGDLTSNAVP